MKSSLSRKFSRSLSSLVSPSRSHQDNILSLPDYYRDTRREIYGPYWGSNDDAGYCSVRTMELPYGYGDDSCRSSFLLDIEFPGEEGEGRKATGCCVDNVPFAFKSCFESDTTRKKLRCVGGLHRMVLKSFLSLLHGRSHIKN